jgi:hypothetical protein
MKIRLIKLMIRVSVLAILFGLMSWGAGFAANLNSPNKDPHQNIVETTIYTCLECHFSSGSSKTDRTYSKTYSLAEAGSEAEYHHVEYCTVCHDMTGPDCGGYTNLYLIACTISTPNSGNRNVKFTSYTGVNSYADGDNTYNGVCEVCHTLTSHHRNNGSDNTEHFDGSNCTVCHPHTSEFSAPYAQFHKTHTSSDKGPKITCTDCHSETDYTIFADGETLANTTVCDTCHSPNGAFDGVNDPVIGAKNNWADGIYKADGITLKSGKEKWCAGCHDDAPAYSKPVIIEPVIVDNVDASFVCSWTYVSGKGYDNSQHYRTAGNGSCTATWIPDIPQAGNYNVYAWWTSYYNRATNAPYTINHSGGSETVRVDQTVNGGQWRLLGTYPFAAGTSGSVVLSDDVNGYVIADAIKFEYADGGTYAPKVIGDNLTYGFYVTGHKINCLSCHDASKKHIDHKHRTYEVDETTYQVVHSYEDGYRLGNIGNNRPMVIPKASVVNPNVLDPSEFALCFKCHDSASILSTTPDNTNFHRDNDPYNRNFHWYHLSMQSRIWDSDWDAVINGTWGVSRDSMPSCTACHNVHGSPGPTMIRHGELISTPGTTDKVPSLNFCYAEAEGVRNCDISAAYPDSVGGSMYFYQGPEKGNYVCQDCHSGYRYYYRTPIDIPKPTDPKVSDPWAKPVSVANDGTSPVVFTAYVVDPNDNLSSVKINLSALGGSANQAMYDDGTNGDVTAGDNIYSFLLSGTTASVGNYTLTITATDTDSNVGTGSVGIVVHNEYGAIIVDNLEAAFVCNWSTSTNTQTWGPDARALFVGAGGDGSCTATWVPDIPAAGNYKVYARWVSYVYRPTSVPYTVNYNGGSQTLYVNQQLNGGTWVQLGTGPFTFAAGTSGSVVLSNNATGGDTYHASIVADAIKLVPQ